MNDEILMGVGNRGTNLPEELEPGVVVELLRVAKFEQRPARYVLHHEVGKAVGGRSAVNQPRNVGMVELRQNLPLVPEATGCLPCRGRVE